MPAIIPRSPHDTWAASSQRRNYTESRSSASTSLHQDTRDDFPQPLDIHYHIQLPSLSMYSNHNPSRTEHIYPNPSIPSSSVQVRQAHDLNVRMPQTMPPGPTMTQGSHHHPSWQHQPYVRVPPLMPPPPVPHKVWILDCKSCGNFLTNRGMKAVLLLRPNVPLYSTDAMPVNCSPSSAIDSPYSSSQANSSDIERFHVSTRTCECLTQTLYCHGCGGSVGYMIVSPCHRCTSSITVTNRTTNGHRFVFYSSEIVACERRYVPGEGGIRSPVVSLLPVPALSGTSPHPHSVTPSNSGIFASLSSNGSLSDDISDFESTTSSPPPLRYPSRSPSFSEQSFHYESTPESPFPDLSPIPSQAQSPQQISTHVHREVPSSRPELCFEPLNAGDNLYWHHLIRSGEMPVVLDNPRARTSQSSHHHRSVKAAEASVARGSSVGQMQAQGRRISVSRGIIAGR